MTDDTRSISRGREALLSTGRGGLGNFRASSTSRDPRPSGPDDFSPTRGREPHVRHVDPLYSTGRGGTGNIRSPSRDHCKPDLTETSDENIVRQHIADDEDAPASFHSTGRGGVGNINRSRSREPTNGSSSTLQSSGRGGAGNIHPGSSVLSSVIDEEERHKLHPQSGVHSTGRGGAANLTPAHEPNVEQYKHQAQDYESTGRGGAGNLVH